MLDQFLSFYGGALLLAAVAFPIVHGLLRAWMYLGNLLCAPLNRAIARAEARRHPPLPPLSEAEILARRLRPSELVS
jgi:hypothetical protein